MKTIKSFDISKSLVWQAYKLVRANKGAAGVDAQSLGYFETNLGNNLYKIWNRISSGSYYPPAVKAVEIPKKDGGVRVLGVPTVSDRIAQMVAKLYLEPKLDPIFHKDSYGYRPRKSAHQALSITRQRCWNINWVLEFDIKGLFDNIDHKLLMKALKLHTQCNWVLLYTERWLVAPMQNAEGKVLERDKGVPQGGVLSPVLSNLFLHYAFDKWMQLNYPNVLFCRYADDGLLHCKSLEQAEHLRGALEKRFSECGLELHPKKTKLVYCKDRNRRGNYENISFDFLGYTFRPRKCKDKYDRYFCNFTPSLSDTAAKEMRQTVRRWRIQLKSDKSIEDISKMFKPILQGWVNYYCLFHKTSYRQNAEQLNRSLTRWAMRKYKKLKGHKRRATHWLGMIARRQPELFPHWKIGFRPSVGIMGAE